MVLLEWLTHKHANLSNHVQTGSHSPKQVQAGCLDLFGTLLQDCQPEEMVCWYGGAVHRQWGIGQCKLM
jgi:hypothetical protein